MPGLTFSNELISRDKRTKGLEKKIWARKELRVIVEIKGVK